MTARDLLIWTIRDQRAHIIDGRGVGLHDVERMAEAGYEPHGRSADGCAMIERIGLLGCRIDGGGMAGGNLHPAAEAVWAWLKRLPCDLLNVAIAYGEKGEAPPLHVPIRAIPLFDGGRARWLSDKGGRHRPDPRYVRVVRLRGVGFCPIDWRPSSALAAALERDGQAWASICQALEAASKARPDSFPGVTVVQWRGPRFA